MGVNAAIWRWTDTYDTSSKRYRRATVMSDVYDAIMDGVTHVAQADFDRQAFVEDVRCELGDPAPEGD